MTDTSFMPRPSEVKGALDLVTADFAYVRWLGNRKGMEEQTTTWDKTVIDRQDDLKVESRISDTVGIEMRRLTFGGILAFALLGLFVYAVVLALTVAYNCTSTCSLSEGVAALLETIGALVSAVVVSELSVTKPKDAPGTRLAVEGYSEGQRAAVIVLASAYILVWLITGLGLVIFGWVLGPAVPQVASAANGWLGFAIAAAYAYFGISPQ